MWMLRLMLHLPSLLIVLSSTGSADNAKIRIGKERLFTREYPDSDKLEVYGMEMELYRRKIRSVRNSLWADLIAREAKALGVDPVQWEKEFFRKNALRNISASEEPGAAQRIAHGDFSLADLQGIHREMLREKLLNALIAKYGVSIEIPKPRPPKIRLKLPEKFLSYGSSDARLKIVEFIDLECPFCAKMSRVNDRLRKSYHKDVLWIFMDYPMEAIHPESMSAHLQVWCASEQNLHVEAINAVLLRTGVGEKLSSTGVRSALQAIGVNIPELEECQRARSDEYTNKIRLNFEFGSSVGIKGTPVIIIGDEPIMGVRSESELRQIIEQHLSQAKQKIR